MTVCNFFLQGRCRYGDKCWNEHPRGAVTDSCCGCFSGFGNRVWINPSQRTGGDYVQPSSFSRGGGGGGVASRDVKSSDFSFSSQNRFTALASHTQSDKDVQSSTDDVDTVQKDMEVWQTSGQWPFSCYSVLPGFVEVSPEELRLEYYSGRASGDLQAYMNSVQQLADQWRSRVQELRTMSSSTRISVVRSSPASSDTEPHAQTQLKSSDCCPQISELKNPGSQTSAHEFGSTASGFGTTSSSSSSSSTGFGPGGFFAPSKPGFGASNTQQASGFGSAFAQPSSGFSAAPAAPAASAASFSFAAPAVENKASSVSTFSFKPCPGGSSAAADVQSSASGAFGGAADTGLFSAHSDLTAEELKEFTAKRFTLGQIPLKAPPADLLVV
uniref:Nucleoporin NUP42 n=1 Tax=Cyprinus carpio TaxID=7962 RepID=A0A8C1UZN6_CYPCA